MALTQTTASMALPAPSGWPYMDLVEDTASSPACFPNVRLIAAVSTRSLAAMPVPWALM